MKIIVSKDKTKVLYVPESVKEISILDAFPGLLREGVEYFSTTKCMVVGNLYNRLKSKVSLLRIDKDVENLVKLYRSNIPNWAIIPNAIADLQYDFQNIALDFLIRNKGGGLLMEPGMGKTRVVYNFIRYHNLKKVLVVCPNPLMFVWEEEQAKCAVNWTIGLIETSDHDEVDDILTTNEIIVISYKRAVILEKLLAQYKFDLMVLDEALIKDPNTQRTKALTRLASSTTHRIIMSGTLINNTPVDSFAPLRFLEPSLVGTSVHRFKDEYCTFQNVYEGGVKTKKKFVTGYRNMEEIRSIIDDSCIVMTKAEWLHLPNKNFWPVHLSLSDEQRAAYYELKSNYITNIEDITVEVDSPLVLGTKLIQISNGFIYHPDEDYSQLELDSEEVKDVPRKTYFFQKNPKIVWLLNEILFGRLQSRRFILWYNMTAERQLIEENFKRAGIRYLVASGSDPKLNEVIAQFNKGIGLDSLSYDILLCQACSLNYGLTVLGQQPEVMEDENFKAIPDLDLGGLAVFTEVFFSLNYSLQRFLQQQDRIHRIGQQLECDYFILMASEIERAIYEVLQEKHAVSKKLLIDIINRISNEPNPERNSLKKYDF